MIHIKERHPSDQKAIHQINVLARVQMMRRKCSA
jgi:hypothetical protein